MLEIKENDFIVIKRWIDSNDKSYLNGIIFKVLAVEGDLVFAEQLTGFICKPKHIFDQSYVEFAKVSVEFVKKVLPKIVK